MTKPALQVLPADKVEDRAPPTDVELKNVRDHAASLWKSRRKIEKLLEEAKTLADEVAVIETKTLPDAMRKIGMRRFELEGGFEIELEDVIHGSIKKADQPKAFEWLNGHGYGSIIKHVIEVSFGMGDEKWAAKFLRDLSKRKRPLEFSRTDAVHAGTLKKFVKERVSEEKLGNVPPAKVLPRDLFGVFEFTRANLIDPAEEARKAADAKARPRRAKKDPSSEVEM